MRELKTLNNLSLQKKLSAQDYNKWLKASKNLPFSDESLYELIEKLWFEIEQERKPWTSGNNPFFLFV